MKNYISAEKNDLAMLCNMVKDMIQQKEFDKCEALIADAMKKYPHSPEPHNLIGVMLEKQGNHVAAMKHFRAAWGLDPTYLPARFNLDSYASFYTKGQCAFDENDCPIDYE